MRIFIQKPDTVTRNYTNSILPFLKLFMTFFILKELNYILQKVFDGITHE